MITVSFCEWQPSIVGLSAFANPFLNTFYIFAALYLAFFDHGVLKMRDLIAESLRSLVGKCFDG